MKNDPLLFEHKITVPFIQEKVASITHIDMFWMTVPKGYPEGQKREYVNARQISMRLAKKYTQHSLAEIGWRHGKRDHATVLHACKTIDNLLDARDPLVLDDFKKIEKILLNWKDPGIKQEKTIFNTEK